MWRKKTFYWAMKPVYKVPHINNHSLNASSILRKFWVPTLIVLLYSFCDLELCLYTNVQVSVLPHLPQGTCAHAHAYRLVIILPRVTNCHLMSDSHTHTHTHTHVHTLHLTHSHTRGGLMHTHYTYTHMIHIRNKHMHIHTHIYTRIHIKGGLLGWKLGWVLHIKLFGHE